MTLTWCSVHALKNKVLLKTHSGFLVLKLRYTLNIILRLKACYSIFELYAIVLPTQS